MALPVSEAHDQAADQAGPGGGGDGREVGEAQAGLAHRTRDQAVELLDMRPRRDLRHHAAIGRMLARAAPAAGRPAPCRRRGRGPRPSRRSSSRCRGRFAVLPSITRPPASPRRTRHSMGLSTAAPHRHARLAAGAGAGNASSAQAPGRCSRRHWPSRMRSWSRSSSTTGDRITGPAAGRDRRQGAVHQGDRGGAAGRPHRSRGAFDEGHADLAARRAGHRRPCCRATTRATR